MLKRKGLNNGCQKINAIITVLNAKTQTRGNYTANHMKPKCYRGSLTAIYGVMKAEIALEAELPDKISKQTLNY